MERHNKKYETYIINYVCYQIHRVYEKNNNTVYVAITLANNVGF